MLVGEHCPSARLTPNGDIAAGMQRIDGHILQQKTVCKGACLSRGRNGLMADARGRGRTVGKYNILPLLHEEPVIYMQVLEKGVLHRAVIVRSVTVGISAEGLS